MCTIGMGRHKNGEKEWVDTGAYAEIIPKHTTLEFLWVNTRMGKRNSFKANKRDFAKEICNLIRKTARKEKRNAEELEKTHRSITTDQEGTSSGVVEEKKMDDQV